MQIRTSTKIFRKKLIKGTLSGLRQSLATFENGEKYFLIHLFVSRYFAKLT